MGRYVHVHLRHAPREDVVLWLNEHFDSYEQTLFNELWYFPGALESILYIYAYSQEEYENEYEFEEWVDLALKLGQYPVLGLVIRVSGRHPGDREVRQFLSLLLSKFDGLIQDEYTDHLWTLAEIEADTQKNEHPFFDYRGWHRGS